MKTGDMLTMTFNVADPLRWWQRILPRRWITVTYHEETHTAPLTVLQPVEIKISDGVRFEN